MSFFVLQRIISALQPELALLLDFLVIIPLSPFDSVAHHCISGNTQNVSSLFIQSLQR